MYIVSQIYQELLKQELLKYKSRELVPFICQGCSLEKKKFKRYLQNTMREGNYGPFCSLKCKGEFYSKLKSQQVSCINCKKIFKKTNSNIKKSSNNFCSKSCSAIYNNKHKKYGIRSDRSGGMAVHGKDHCVR